MIAELAGQIHHLKHSETSDADSPKSPTADSPVLSKENIAAMFDNSEELENLRKVFDELKSDVESRVGKLEAEESMEKVMKTEVNERLHNLEETIKELNSLQLSYVGEGDIVEEGDLEATMSEEVIEMSPSDPALPSGVTSREEKQFLEHMCEMEKKISRKASELRSAQAALKQINADMSGHFHCLRNRVDDIEKELKNNLEQLSAAASAPQDGMSLSEAMVVSMKVSVSVCMSLFVHV